MSSLKMHTRHILKNTLNTQVVKALWEINSECYTNIKGFADIMGNFHIQTFLLFTNHKCAKENLKYITFSISTNNDEDHQNKLQTIISSIHSIYPIIESQIRHNPKIKNAQKNKLIRVMKLLLKRKYPINYLYDTLNNYRNISCESQLLDDIFNQLQMIQPFFIMSFVHSLNYLQPWI